MSNEMMNTMNQVRSRRKNWFQVGTDHVKDGLRRITRRSGPQAQMMMQQTARQTRPQMPATIKAEGAWIARKISRNYTFS